jgi:hypothetical protein
VLYLLLINFLQHNPKAWAHAKTGNGETGLHLASIHGFTSVTKLLLEYGADPNVRTTYEMVRHPTGFYLLVFLLHVVVHTGFFLTGFSYLLFRFSCWGRPNQQTDSFLW